MGLLSVKAGLSQPVLNNPASSAANGTNSGEYWSRVGNTNSNGTNNVFGTAAGFNSQIWTTTNGVYRMMINNGGTAVTDGYIGIGNSLPTTFVPVDRFHLHQTATGTTAIRFTNNNTGLTATDGFQIALFALSDAVIRNFEASRNVIIATNDGATSTFNRFKVGSNADNGFVTIGNVSNFAATQALLHLTNFTPNMANTALRGEMFRSDGENGVINSWRLFTGATAATSTEKFSVRIPANSNNAELYSTAGNMYLFTNGSSGIRERIRISSAIGNLTGVQQPNSTRVTINYGAGFTPINNPVAMLNIGFEPPQVPNGGQRQWMDVGAFICGGSDNIYIGMKNEDPAGNIDPSLGDRMDAVISWGDNDGSVAGFGPDRLRVIFTRVQNPTTANGASSNNGLEVMRMTPQNNGQLVYSGVGGDPVLNQYSGTGGEPGNIWEVNSQNATTVAGGSSGLRFTNLTTASPTTPNPGAGLLAVNSLGDVIYVPAPTGVPFGGICGTSPTALPGNWEIPMSTFNYVFSGQNATAARVGIGLGASVCTPQAKLHVVQNTGAAGSINILAENTTGVTDIINVKSIATGPVTNANRRVAGWFESPFITGLQQTAIFVPNGGGVVQIGYTYSSISTGLLEVNGTIVGSSFQPSDSTLKTSINTITNGYSIINQLRPVSYNWKSTVINDNGMQGIHYGFIAQEVEQVLPHAVRTKANGTKIMSYDAIIPYLVKAVQEERAITTSLAAQLNTLQQQVNSCCNAAARTAENGSATDTISLSNVQSIVLSQNVPNPFAEQTSINYHIPESIAKAQIFFYDASGKLINSIEITNRGDGQLFVFANDLSNGTYTYALVADGNIIDTKKMIKTGN